MRFVLARGKSWPILKRLNNEMFGVLFPGENEKKKKWKMKKKLQVKGPIETERQKGFSAVVSIRVQANNIGPRASSRVMRGCEGNGTDRVFFYYKNGEGRPF